MRNTQLSSPRLPFEKLSYIQHRRQHVQNNTPTYSTPLSFLYIKASHEQIYYTINQSVIIHL
jgi:hypothetical protein